MTETGSEQAGLSIVSNTESILTHPLARASAVEKGNYPETIENSLTEQQGTLIETRKRKRSIGRSGKSNSPKRSRIEPALTVTAAEGDDDSENEDDPQSEAISLGTIVQPLNCRVPGCKKVFPDTVQLNGHLLVNHGIEKYACKVKECTESYATWDELTTHRNSAHDNLGNEWPCGQCEVTCKNYHQLVTHTYHYHENGQSDKCDYTEKARTKVQTHQVKHQPTKYHCTYPGCSSFFYEKSHLTSHFLGHIKGRPFLCSKCYKAFAHKRDLTRHERIHSGLKPYSCTWPQCDFSASVQSNVVRHIRSVHFGLPQTKKKQQEKGIIDNRDARLFVKTTTNSSN